MRTRSQRTNDWRLFGAAAFLTAFSLVVMLTGCASVQHDPDYDIPPERTLKDAKLCLQAGPCTVLQVANNNFYDAVIYLNGGRVGQITGGHSEPIFVHDSQLRGSRCAQILVRLIGPGTMAGSTNECIRATEFYHLDIDPSSNLFPLHIWLNPRR